MSFEVNSLVKGIELFREHFADSGEQYVLIGGAAATLAMADAGREFRATKDLDIVLHIEAPTAAFGAAFWSFVVRGGYEIRGASNPGKPVLYRFHKPASVVFSAMLGAAMSAAANLPFGQCGKPVPDRSGEWALGSPVSQTRPDAHSQ